jgi:hypothetical protein
LGPKIGRWFDIAVPIGTEPIMRGRATSLDQRGSFWLNVMIRVKPAQALASATAALLAVQGPSGTRSAATGWIVAIPATRSEGKHIP